MTEAQATIWSATLTPNRSLGRRGFVVLMIVVAALNAGASFFFYVQGAWPIVGFMGLDVALLYWAFSRNYADARIAERVEITEHELVLRRRQMKRPETERRFVRRWVRVELDEDRERELVGSLYLRFKGERTEIGKFLSPAERKTLAGALRKALA
jgi:uncharacterized membrane protein